MVPVVELRGGVPAGVAMGLPIPLALLAGVIGNMIPVPFVILFIRRIFKWIRVYIPKLGGLIDRLEQRAYRKMNNENLVRLQAWGLLMFVAIPLPGTGAWTGALIAALMDLRLKNAVPVIFVGVVIAGLIMTALTYGVTVVL
ncbi:MAG: small multi-drug export protein [Oscillospiraceae bacterium]|nr:small multi-drug export protein [Oscillospiraceae bacterium]